MVDTKRAVLALAVLCTLLPMAGCDVNLSGTPTAADWARLAGPDLNCPGVRATYRDTPQRYDIDGDGFDETFVDLICASSDRATAPDQLEIFGGMDRSSRLIRLSSVSAPPDQQLFLADGCVYFTGPNVVVIGRMRATADPEAPATVPVQQVSTWKNGKGIVAGKITILRSTSLPAGCRLGTP